MNNEQKPQSLPEAVAAAIRCGDVKMRPRWHFILKAALAVIGGVLLVLVLLYLISFIIFMLRSSGIGLIPAFGVRGWLRFVVALPWLLILLSILFILVLELLVRRYSFAYQRPLMYSAVGIIVMVIAGGFVVAGTHFHERFSGFMNRQFMMERTDIHPGRVDGRAGSGFMMTDPHGRMLRILVASDTISSDDPGLGDTVIVFGDVDGSSTVRAFGIRRNPQESQGVAK